MVVVCEMQFPEKVSLSLPLILIKKADFVKAIKELSKAIKKELKTMEPELQVEISEIESPKKVMELENSRSF